MDPLAEKYYGVSPYVYCAGNPVNKIDILGLTDYYVNDRTGEITSKENEKADNFYIVNDQGEKKLNSDGEVITEQFENGTFNIDAVATVSANGKEVPFYTYTVKDNESASQILEFLGQTNVEWSLGTLEDSNNNTMNYIGTLQTPGHSVSMTSYLTQFDLVKDSKITRSDHSHNPKDRENRNSKFMYERASPKDVENIDKTLEGITYRVYYAPHQRYTYYNKNGQFWTEDGYLLNPINGAKTSQKK